MEWPLQAILVINCQSLQGASKQRTGFAGPEHLPKGSLKAPAAINRSQILWKVLQQDPFQLPLSRFPAAHNEGQSLSSAQDVPCETLTVMSTYREAASTRAALDSETLTCNFKQMAHASGVEPLQQRASRRTSRHTG